MDFVLPPLCYEYFNDISYCEIMRKMKLILVWQENLLSFWVTLGCLVTGVTLLVLPTMFLIQWACRLLIWIGLGKYRVQLHDRFVLNDSNYYDVTCMNTCRTMDSPVQCMLFS